MRTAADGTLLGVTHADGSRRDCDFVLVSPRTHPLRHLLDALGARVNDEPDAECILVPSDDSGLTSVPGVWVTGNVRDGNAQVSDAAAQGLKAAIAINAALVKETVDAAEADAG